MLTVVYQNQGTDFPPIVTKFESRSASDAFVVGEALGMKPGRGELVTKDTVLSSLAKCSAFIMDSADGAKHVWSVQDL